MNEKKPVGEQLVFGTTGFSRYRMSLLMIPGKDRLHRQQEYLSNEFHDSLKPVRYLKK